MKILKDLELLMSASAPIILIESHEESRLHRAIQ